MSEVFIAYHREDMRIARQVAEALELEGFGVWWPVELVPGAEYFRSHLNRQLLTEAKALLVLWSRASIESVWVLSEADIGRSRNCLVPVIIDAVEIPLGFRNLQTADLRSWHGEPDHRGWQQVMNALRLLTGRPTTAPRSLEPHIGRKVEVKPDRRYSRPTSSPKTQLFIAHASDDKPRLRGILSVLIETGFQLWIDKPHRIGLSPQDEVRISDARIRYGADWKESIKAAIDRSTYVLAFWSKTAAQGLREQFHYEIFIGLIQSKLRQCRIDDVSFDEIRMPYIFSQIADLSDFKDNSFHPELEHLIQDFE